MSQQKEKIKYLLPGDKSPLDTTVKTINVTTIVLSSIFIAVVITSLSFLILWNNIPLLPLPPSNQTPFYHLIAFWRFVIPYFPLGNYVEYIYQWKNSGDLEYLGWRYLIACILGIVSGIYSIIYLWKPVGGIKHLYGTILLKGKEAYDDLKREFKFLSDKGRGSSLIIGADGNFDPNIHTKENLKEGTYIELPEKLRRSHSMFLGGTGRGKTQLIMYLLVSQIYTQIRKGKRVKLMIADTPKGDYDRFFLSKDVIRINPTEKGGVCWDIAKDINVGLLAEAFWKGKIPPNDADPIWSNAAIALGTGCMRYLQVVCPNTWNYGMLAHLFSKSGAELEKIVLEHYPEASQILRSAGETLSSVMFNLGTYTTDIVNLARIYDGYDIKKIIKQTTAKSLKNKVYLNSIFVDMMETEVLKQPEVEQSEKDKELHKQMQALIMTKVIMFKGVCLYLNSNLPDWRWVDFAEFIEQDKNTQANLVLPYLNETEGKIVNNMNFYQHWMLMASTICYYAKDWDNYEKKDRFSLREWLTNENPEKKILLLKPSESYPTLTEGLIKGILYYTNSIILGDLKDNRTRRFHILIDELQSYGNINTFISPALSLYRSRGVSLHIAFQDMAQIVKIYGQEFVDFMNSNIGNIFILGVNNGFTANKLSELLGEKKIQKLHRSVNGEGQRNEDLQEHDEKVIYANEWNMLGANDATMSINYLYLVANLNPAYILSAPIINYKVRHEVKTASWITHPIKTIPELPNLEPLWLVSDNRNKKVKVIKKPDPFDEENYVVES